jgi:SAM-dependent methyltransferase
MAKKKKVGVDLPYYFSEERKLAELQIANKVRGKNKFKVLDVCCRRFPRGFGVDRHPSSNADLLLDVHDLKVFDDDQFDLTVCVEGIEHLDNPSKAVQEWERVSKSALMITTQNLNCWRRWLKIPFTKKNVVTSIDHIYGWNQYTFYNFFLRNFPAAHIKLSWYNRYPKKTSNLKPSWLFSENIAAFVWFGKLDDLNDMAAYAEVFFEAKRLIESRPESDPLWLGSSEYVVKRKLSSYDKKGVGD